MKKVKTILKIQAPAGKATPAPPIGPTLAQHGINIMEFVNAFNTQTAQMGDVMVPAEITVYEDRTFDFKLKTPPAAYLIKKAAGLEKGSGEPNKQKAGKISRAQLREIAKTKLPDLNTQNLEKALKIVEGTAKSLGIEIES